MNLLIDDCRKKFSIHLDTGGREILAQLMFQFRAKKSQSGICTSEFIVFS